MPELRPTDVGANVGTALTRRWHGRTRTLARPPKPQLRALPAVTELFGPLLGTRQGSQGTGGAGPATCGGPEFLNGPDLAPGDHRSRSAAQPLAWLPLPFESRPERPTAPTVDTAAPHLG